MEDFNSNITDKEIRELLKRRLMQDENDLLTNKLIEMEAKIAFANEPITALSLQQEQLLMKKIKSGLYFHKYFKWLFIVSGVFILMMLSYFIWGNYKSNLQNKIPAYTNSAAVNKMDRVYIVTDSTGNICVNTSHENFEKAEFETEKGEEQENEVKPAEALVPFVRNKVKEKVESKGVIDSELPFPILTEKEIKSNNFSKRQMVRRVLEFKKNKARSEWNKIPRGQVSVNGAQIECSEFYIPATEITNAQYKVFITDLLIQGKREEYLQMLPDTTDLTFSTKEYLRPSTYFWNPIYELHPVLNIKREAAIAYCNWLKEEILKSDPNHKLPSFEIRLPYDTEWILASQGGNPEAVYPWSPDKRIIKDATSIQSEEGCYLCNFSPNKHISGLRDECSKKQMEKAFGKFARNVNDSSQIVSFVYAYIPNEYGLYNMSGNVAEMVVNYKTQQPGTKGGSWNSDQEHVKINSPDEYKGITSASCYIGFRPILIITTK